jgi:hypothetical protein
MAKKTIRYSDEHQAALGKLLRTLAYRHGLWKVFCDFVAVSALALSNAADRNQYAEREAQYMKIIANYNKEEAEALAKGLAYVVMALEVGMCDFLGSLFMSLELGDSWKGQFFTPYEISRLMAQMNLGDQVQPQIEQKGFISICDPCVGGGAMIIAAAHAMHDADINYQRHMHVTAIDIDIVAVHMAYIQFSLLHIPAVIYHGNSLSMEIWSTWRTPAHVLGFWDSKLRRANTAAADEKHEIHAAPVQVVEPQTELEDVPVFAARMAPRGAILVPDQMALF